MVDRREITSAQAGGRYAISGTVEAMLAHRPLTEHEKTPLTNWITDQHRKGKECPHVTSYILAVVIGRSG
jgi:hypothetical protein